MEHLTNSTLGHVPPSPGNYFPDCVSTVYTAAVGSSSDDVPSVCTICWDVLAVPGYHSGPSVRSESRTIGGVPCADLGSKHMNADHVRDAFRTIAANWYLYPWWSFPFWKRSICNFCQRTTSNLARWGRSYMRHFCENILHFLQNQRISTLQTMRLSMSHHPLFPIHIYRVFEFSCTTYQPVITWTRRDRRSENTGIDMETMEIKHRIAAQRSIEIHGNVIWTNRGILTLSRLREATSNGHLWGMRRYVRCICDESNALMSGLYSITFRILGVRTRRTNPISS